MSARDDLSKQIQEYLRIAIEGKWVILSIFAVVVAGTWLYTMQQDDIFASGVSVRIKQSKDILNAPAASGGLEGLGYGGERILANEILILQSTAIAYKVADRMLAMPVTRATMDTFPALKAAGRPSTMRKMARVLHLEDLLVSMGFGKLDTSSAISPRDLLAGRVRAQMSAEPVQGVDFLTISAVSTSPFEAALIANLYVEAYRERNLESARQNITTARSFLESQLGTKQDSLASAENDVRSFQQSSGVVSLDAETQQLVGQVAGFEAQREQARIELQAAQEVHRNFTEQLRKIEPELVSQLKQGVDPTLKSLLQEKAQLELQIQDAEYNRKTQLRDRPELEPLAAKQIEEKTRRLQEVVSQIDALTEKLTSASNLSASPVDYVRELRQKILQQDVQIESVKVKIASLDQTIRTYNTKFEGIPSQMIEYARLERRRLSYDKLFSLLDDKYQETLINEQTTMGNVDVVDLAEVPGAPVKPNRPLNMLLGVLLGLGLGFGIAVLLRYLDTTIRNPEDVEKLGLPVLTFIPLFGSGDTGADRSESLVTLTAPQSPPSEAYRTMRAAIESCLPDGGRSGCIIVTSPAPKEGKSTAIANLAVSAANSGRRVLLVDADLRRPVQHQVFGLEREPGLSNALIGEVPVRDCIRKSAVPGLHLVPCGAIPSHPAELLGSSRMDRFITLVRQHYDLVLFDAPPVIAMADTLVLAKHTDGVVMVISADRTKTLGLEKAAEMLESNNAKLLGVVVNRFNANRVYYSYYRYYYQNYYYYSTEGEKKRKGRRARRDAGESEAQA